MGTIHLVLVRVISPILLLLLFNGHLLVNKHSSCLALRYTEDNDLIDWEALVDEQAAIDSPTAREDQDDLDFLGSLDRETRKPAQSIQRDDTDNTAIDNPSERSQQNNIESPWQVDTATSRVERLESVKTVNSIQQGQRRNDIIFLVIVSTSTVVGVLGLIAALIFWYKIQKKSQAALDAEYPSYGVQETSSKSTIPKSAVSDRKLAQSAQMFHYQQQRQQMMAQERAQFDTKPVNSDDSDDEAPGGGDYTVYECPGLAPTGEMEVRNPLFAEPDPSASTAVTTSFPTMNNHYPQPLSSSPKEKSSP